MFFAFSTKQRWINELQEIIEQVAKARGIDANAIAGNAVSESGTPVESVPKNAEDFLSIVDGLEMEEVSRGELPSLPFYIATVFVNDHEIGKVDITDRDLSRLPSGLRLYFDSILSGIIDKVIGWTYSLFNKL